MEQFSLSFALPERRVWSLRELSDGIRGALERGFGNIWVAGEISGVRLLPSGHCYFSLKDSDAQIKCVCWKLAYWRLKFKPKDGVQVIARGRVDIYELRSEYQFVVEALEPQGEGALQLAFEQLKQKLGAEGLFDAARKRALPRYPRRIGIVTSPQGAVIQDFINILTRRFPGIHIRLFPARVQGAEAASDVIRGLRYFGQSGWAEVIVLARGGGSIEDLWTFNEEPVARAIAASPIPVVSAIGHETDVTIADFVADLRAPTPSAAAELIVVPQRDLLERSFALETRAIRAIRYRLALLARRLHEQAIDRAHSILHRSLSRRMQRVDDNEERLRTAIRQQIAARERRRRVLEERLRHFDLRPRLRRDRQRLNAASFRLASIMQARLHQRRQRFETAAAKLSQLNPRLILTRGYAIVMNDAGAILREANAAPPGSGLRILFADSELRAVVSPDSPPDKSN
ncbi:MAG TPA: exodeoxyribonuclease VII large subunit [Bryobacteraceae bacterium]|nr:exodeoxyribonuclease VII large subunit [Bryobacteraceae bacterium]